VLTDFPGVNHYTDGFDDPSNGGLPPKLRVGGTTDYSCPEHNALKSHYYDGHGNDFSDEDEAIESQDLNDMIDYWAK
jgi:hypothetical protein